MLISRLTKAIPTLDSATHGRLTGASDPHSSDTNPGSARHIGSESGFTLIELMVVLLIIAILLAIAIPTFLGVTNTAGDRAAQSNLTNALTEAKALYQVSQTYSPTTGAYTSGQFTSQAPEFIWQSTACSSQSNCISYDVVNVATANDGQGLILAAYSAKTTTCWYLVDLEAVPLSGLTGGIVSGGTNKNAMGAAGVFYGKSKTGATDCLASAAANPTGGATWGNNYSGAGYVY
jgi:prepilin-type N-terminal cleavage/methylation domain-containing protein